MARKAHKITLKHPSAPWSNPKVGEKEEVKREEVAAEENTSADLTLCHTSDPSSPSLPLRLPLIPLHLLGSVHVVMKTCEHEVTEHWKVERDGRQFGCLDVVRRPLNLQWHRRGLRWRFAPLRRDCSRRNMCRPRPRRGTGKRPAIVGKFFRFTKCLVGENGRLGKAAFGSSTFTTNPNFSQVTAGAAFVDEKLPVLFGAV